MHAELGRRAVAYKSQLHPTTDSERSKISSCPFIANAGLAQAATEQVIAAAGEGHPEDVGEHRSDRRREGRSAPVSAHL